MMGSHDTGCDRSQKERIGPKGHITNGIKGSRRGSMEPVVHTWWGSKMKAECNSVAVLLDSVNAVGQGGKQKQRDKLKTRQVSREERSLSSTFLPLIVSKGKEIFFFH